MPKTTQSLIEKITTLEARSRDEFWKNKIPKSAPSPNSLTIIRIIGAILLLFLKLDMAYFIPAVIFLFLTDYFDGIIARTQDRETAFGEWADHSADKLLLITVVYRIYFINPAFWSKFILPAIIPEIMLGIFFILIKSSIKPSPLFWGRLKFALYAFAIIAFMFGQLLISKSFLIFGLFFAYLSVGSYFMRGYRARTLKQIKNLAV